MNLFLISGVNHLYHVQNIIKNYGYKNNILFILQLPHTNEGPAQLNNIKKQIIHDLFIKIENVILKDIHSAYKKLIKEGYQLENVFSTAYTGVFFEIMRDTKKRNGKYILYEEGLSTYKTTLIKKNGKRQIQNSNVNVGNSSSILSKNKNSLKSKLKKFIWFLIKNTKKFKRFFNYMYYSGYDYAYVTYPEKLSKVMKVKHYQKNYKITNFPVNDIVKSVLEIIDNNVLDNSLLFLSQPIYHLNITEEEYIDSVFEILEDMEDQNIVIKMHPREPISIKKYYQEKANNSNKNIKILDTNTDEIEVPVELILSTSNKLKKVVSFSSTTLIYGPKLNNSIETISIFYSIVGKFHDRCKSSFIVKEIEKELRKFNHIKYIY